MLETHVPEDQNALKVSGYFPIHGCCMLVAVYNNTNCL
jgi:hypothetical protein